MAQKLIRESRFLGTLARYRRPAVLALVVGLTALGLLALHLLVAEVHFRDVRAALREVAGWQIVAAIGFTAVSYFLLTLYDVIALRIIGRSLPWRTAALASFTSFTLSHNLGLSLLTGGSARYRVYSANGLGAMDIARIVALSGGTFWAGIAVSAAAALLLHPEALAYTGLAIGMVPQVLAALAILSLIAAFFWRTRRGGSLLTVSGWSLPMPTSGQALSALGVSVLDLAAACAALSVLIPQAGPALFPAIFLAYVVALVAAAVTHIPGGVGVFEAMIIAALPGVPKPELLAALVVYRVIYYLLPLLVAGLIIAVHEYRAWRRPVLAAYKLSHSVVSSMAPMVLSALSFTGGLVLLVSGSLPAIPARLQALRLFVPLPFVEASHIAASLAGTGLLLLAPGLYRRLDGAFLLTRTLLIAGAVFSLSKGVDFEEALILGAIAALLQWSRKAFYRRTALTVRSFSSEWIAACVIAVGLSVWITLFAFKHAAFNTDLWWQFAWHGGASRAIRGSFAASVMLIGAIVIWLFSPAERQGDTADGTVPAIASALSRSDRSDVMLAWTGDKRFLELPGREAFLMYQVQGSTWIVMGDPVGPREQWSELLWRIRERADAAQGRLLLYQLSPEALPLAIDLGLRLVKYGEEALVDLTRFDLEGPEGKGLRYSERRALRDGARFEVVPAAAVPPLIPALRTISDQWLKAKHQSEKAFSVGRFDPTYLARCDCAIIRHEGRIAAFANIWKAAPGGEISVDLMRYGEAIPQGTMDLLLISLMRWGKAQGYTWFNLGLAPLSGIAARRLAPFWARAGAFLYRHGDSVYGFEGLRAYKDKFSPVWTSRYIAGPSGIGLARALFDLQTLISGSRASAAFEKPVNAAA